MPRSRSCRSPTERAKKPPAMRGKRFYPATCRPRRFAGSDCPLLLFRGAKEVDCRSMVKACRRLPVNTTTLVLFHRLRIEDVERRADNTPQSGARVRNGNSSPSPPVTLALSLECHHCHHPPRVVLILRNKTLRATHRSRTFQQKLQKLRSELTNQNTIQQVKAHESR